MERCVILVGPSNPFYDHGFGVKVFKSNSTKPRPVDNKKFQAAYSDYPSILISVSKSSDSSGVGRSKSHFSGVPGETSPVNGLLLDLDRQGICFGVTLGKPRVETQHPKGSSTSLPSGRSGPFGRNHRGHSRNVEGAHCTGHRGHKPDTPGDRGRGLDLSLLKTTRETRDVSLSHLCDEGPGGHRQSRRTSISE